MKFILILLCVAMLVAVGKVSAAVALEELEPNPDHPNACFNPRTGEAQPVGSSWPGKGRCTRSTCSKNERNGKYTIQHVSCGSVASPNPPCTLVENNKEAYPTCCPKVVCP